MYSWDSGSNGVSGPITLRLKTWCERCGDDCEWPVSHFSFRSHARTAGTGSEGSRSRELLRPPRALGPLSSCLRAHSLLVAPPWRRSGTSVRLKKGHHARQQPCRRRYRTAEVGGLLARRRKVTGDLRVDAEPVEWAGENRHGDRARLAAVRRRAGVLAALASGDCAEDEPQD